MKTLLVARSPYTNQAAWVLEVDHIYDSHEAVAGSIASDTKRWAIENPDKATEYDIDSAEIEWDEVDELLLSEDCPWLCCVNSIKASPANLGIVVVDSDGEL